MYFGVIAAGLIGAAVARFRPYGMSLVMYAMAFIQGIVTVNALIAGMHQSSVSSITEILGINGFFITLFIISAILFRYAEEINTHLMVGSEN